MRAGQAIHGHLKVIAGSIDALLTWLPSADARMSSASGGLDQAFAAGDAGEHVGAAESRVVSIQHQPFDSKDPLQPKFGGASRCFLRGASTVLSYGPSQGTQA